MTTRVRLRRGTTAEHQAFTGAQAEITYDTQRKSLIVHDGVKAGGYETAKTEDAIAFSVAFGW